MLFEEGLRLGKNVQNFFLIFKDMKIAKMIAFPKIPQVPFKITRHPSNTSDHNFIDFSVHIKR
jgi:hypothetical protein